MQQQDKINELTARPEARQDAAPAVILRTRAVVGPRRAPSRAGTWSAPLWMRRSTRALASGEISGPTSAPSSCPALTCGMNTWVATFTQCASIEPCQPAASTQALATRPLRLSTPRDGRRRCCRLPSPAAGCLSRRWCGHVAGADSLCGADDSTGRTCQRMGVGSVPDCP